MGGIWSPTKLSLGPTGTKIWDTGLKGLSPGSQDEDNAPVDPVSLLRPSRAFSPLVIFMMGRRGQGKTLGMTALASEMQTAYKLNHEDRRIYSNYSLKFTPPEHSDPYLLDNILSNPFDYKESVICVDEIASAFPGRRAMANVNVAFANFLTQIRKLRSECIFTTQFPAVVDRDMLVQVDLFIRCEKRMGGKSIKFYIYDWWGQWTGKDYSKPWPPQPDTQDWEVTLHGTDAMFGQYRTDEIIIPLRSDNRDEQLGNYYDIEEVYEATNADEVDTPTSENFRSEDSMNEKQNITTQILVDGFGVEVEVNHARARLGLTEGTLTNEATAQILEANGYRVNRDVKPWKAIK